MPQLSQTTLDELGQFLAPILAPHVAAEMAKQKPASGAPAKSGEVLDYDSAICAMYVGELGTGVLNRALDFFTKLDSDGFVGSVELAQQLSIGTPRNIPANLTNSLKKRAKTMGLSRPWKEATDQADRTVWLDRDGIAALMIDAIKAEQQKRFVPPPKK